jgi:hypothetical protein
MREILIGRVRRKFGSREGEYFLNSEKVSFAWESILVAIVTALVRCLIDRYAAEDVPALAARPGPLMRWRLRRLVRGTVRDYFPETARSECNLLADDILAVGGACTAADFKSVAREYGLTFKGE